MVTNLRKLFRVLLTALLARNFSLAIRCCFWSIYITLLMSFLLVIIVPIFPKPPSYEDYSRQQLQIELQGDHPEKMQIPVTGYSPVFYNRSNLDNNLFFERIVLRRYAEITTRRAALSTQNPSCSRPVYPEQMYVVLSCYVEPVDAQECMNPVNETEDHPCSCAFMLPIAVAWYKRWGFNAVVIFLTDEAQKWQSEEPFRFVIGELQRLDATVFSFPVPNNVSSKDLAVLMRLVRAYGAKFIIEGSVPPPKTSLFEFERTELLTPKELFDRTYVLTSDLDLLPNRFSGSNVYFPDPGGLHDVIIAPRPDSCCPRVDLDGTKCPIYSISGGVGMMASTWREVIGYSIDVQKNIVQEMQNKMSELEQFLNASTAVDIYADEIAFAILFDRWLKRDESAHNCRVEIRSTTPAKVPTNPDDSIKINILPTRASNSANYVLTPRLLELTLPVHSTEAWTKWRETLSNHLSVKRFDVSQYWTSFKAAVDNGGHSSNQNMPNDSSIDQDSTTSSQ